MNIANEAHWLSDEPQNKWFKITVAAPRATPNAEGRVPERDALPVFKEIARIAMAVYPDPNVDLAQRPWTTAITALGNPSVVQYRDLENKREIFVKPFFGEEQSEVYKDVGKLPGVKVAEAKSSGIYVVHGRIYSEANAIEMARVLSDKQKRDELRAAAAERFEKTGWPEQKETVKYHVAVIDPGAIKFASNGGHLDNVVVIKTHSIALLNALDNAGLVIYEPSPIARLKDIKAAYPPEKPARNRASSAKPAP